MHLPAGSQIAASFIGVIVAATQLAFAARADETTPKFNRDIRPILSDRCFTCHGPDGNKREAELRLDTPEGAHEYAIVPGDLDSSEVWSRISSDDPDLQMPPAGSKKPALSERERDLIRRWIEAGAEYQPHWAYIPPQRATPPEIKQADWPRNAIDNFLLASIEREGLTPSPKADRTTLVRRAYLDLTGLPPTQEQIDEFLADQRADDR